MRRLVDEITIIDILMVMALLLIVAGMFAPHFVKKRAQPGGAPAADPAPVSRPLH
jgi:hypothetical protein